MVGAKRDPGWGTVLLLGLGGIWVEALGDVQLLPVDADETQIRRSPRQAPFGKASGRRPRRAAGRRRRRRAGRDGDRPIDAGLFPRLTEIDVNPLMVHAKGQGATALDALIVAD